MHLLVAHAPAAAGRPIDTDAPAGQRAAATTVAHAAQHGSVVAVCGASVRQPGDRAWPPSGEPTCPQCVEAVRGFTVD